MESNATVWMRGAQCGLQSAKRRDQGSGGVRV